MSAFDRVKLVRRTRGWAVLALVSLALNLFLGGVLLGQVFRDDRKAGGFGPIALLRSPEDLDPATREMVEHTREKHRAAIVGSMDRARKARAEAIDALCASDFDEAKARGAFDAFRAATSVAQGAMNESLIDASKQMTPEQRLMLRESLQRGRGPEGRGGEGRRGRGRGGN